MTKQLFISGLKHAFGFGILGYMVWSHWELPAGQGGGIKDALQGPIHVGYLGVTLLLCLMGSQLNFVRWFVLVRAQGLPFTLLNALRLGAVGAFFNTFLPGSVSGDVVKATFLAREQSRRAAAVSTVLIDRAIGLWGLCWVVVLLGWPFWAGGFLPRGAEAKCLAILLGYTGVVGASLAGWFALGWLSSERAEGPATRLGRLGRIGPAAAEFGRALWAYRKQGKSVWLALLITLGGHFCFVLSYYFAAAALHPVAGGFPSAFVSFVIIPIGMTAQAGFPTPGGIGGGEYLFGKLYELVGCPWVNGMKTAFAQRAVGWGLGFGYYLVYLGMRPTLRAKASQAEEAESLAA